MQNIVKMNIQQHTIHENFTFIYSYFYIMFDPNPTNHLLYTRIIISSLNTAIILLFLVMISFKDYSLKNKSEFLTIEM